LYFPGYGNPELRPEKGRNFEFSVSGRAGAGRWAVNAYETRIDNLIAYDATAGAPANIARARIRGVEAVYAVRLGGFDIRATATLLDPLSDGGRYAGNVLPRRARRSGRLDIDRAFGDVSVGATLFAAGRRFDNLSNTTVMGGYATVDLRLVWRLHDHWRLQARVENLFNHTYETAATYNQPGRSVYLGVGWQL
ncbi:MAG: TonB-dependent receptor, partial [Verrucomicrobia bacterium]